MKRDRYRWLAWLRIINVEEEVKGTQEVVSGKSKITYTLIWENQNKS